AESFETVQDAVKASLTDCKFAVRPTPDVGVLRAKMGFWLGEKGNKTLAQWLGFIFKVESISAVITAYTDGTTAVVLRESTFGGNIAGGVVGAVNPLGGIAGSVAGS